MDQSSGTRLNTGYPWTKMTRFFGKLGICVFILMIALTATTETPGQLSKLFGKNKKPEQAPTPCFPVRDGDQVWVVSTRSICPTHFLKENLSVKVRQGNDWVVSNIDALIDAHRQDELRTILYTHGNRQNRSWAEYRGLQGYSLLTNGTRCLPIRYVIWDWPSEDCGKPVRAYVPTVNRAMSEGFAVAWFLDSLGSGNRISLFGYSLGTQVLVSALEWSENHFGNLETYRLGALAPVTACRWPKCDSQARAVYNKIESLNIIYSSRDYAVRAFRAGCGLNKSCGKVGIERLKNIDGDCKVVQSDVVQSVGRSHGIQEYFSSCSVARQMMAFLADDCGCLDGECGHCACRDCCQQSWAVSGCGCARSKVTGCK